MLKCIYIFFEVFFVIKKIQYEFFSFERLGRMHEDKSFFFENQVFLIPDLYFYDIKIQTNLSLNDVEKSVEKSQIFKKYRYIIKKTHKKREKK
jgi:hypothetical protein